MVIVCFLSEVGMTNKKRNNDYDSKQFQIKDDVIYTSEGFEFWFKI